MNNLNDNRVVRAFADLRASGRKALLPFLTAGYPDLQTTEALLHEFVRRGVRVCELGIPYSDPIADGPVIQTSYTEALAAGITSDAVFNRVRSFRAATSRRRERAGLSSGQELAILAMVSYAIVFRHGVERYVRDAAAAGFDGLIIPDLPLEEESALEVQAARCGLCNVLLIAPTTPPQRRYRIARRSRGFIYFISVAGITGERKALPAETIRAVGDLRKHTDTPVCVGFGISSPQMVRTVCRVADGAVVGSAIVHRIADAVRAGLPRRKTVHQAGRFVGQLLTGLR